MQNIKYKDKSKNSQYFGISGLFPKFIVTIIAISLFLAISWQINTSHLENNLTIQIENHFHIIGANVNEYIKQWIDFYTLLLKQTASLPDIQVMVTEKQAPILATIQQYYEAIYLAFTVDLKGENIGRSDNKPLKYYGDREYYKQIIDKKYDLGRQVVIGKTSGKPALILSTPIYNNISEVIGVNAIALKLTDITEEITNTKIGDTGVTFLLNENGEIIAHPNEDLSQKRKNFADHPAYQAFKQGNTKKIIYNQNGEKYIAYAIPSIFNWVIIIEQHYDDAFLPIRKSAKASITLLIIAIIGLLVLSYLLMHFGLLPIQTLANNMTRIGVLLKNKQFNKFDGVHLDTQRKDEIGLLNRITQDLAQNIKESQLRLIKINTTLEDRVKERTQDLTNAYKKLKESQAKLIQSEKMASLGQMIAGVAHEINTPLGYVRSTTETSSTLVEDMIKLLQAYQILFDYIFSNDTDETKVEQQVNKIQALKSSTDIDLEYIEEDFQKIFENIFYGIDQIAELVDSLKNFSRKDETKIENVDINDCIKNALLLTKNMIKNIELNTELDINLKPIIGSPSQINQVLINLISNAVQAIDTGMGKIIIATKQHTDFIEIKIQDNGQGIPKHLMTKIFDPFFTTKKVGEGTGLGLSISFNIIKEHQGKIKVKSEEGKGTLFQILLPNEQQNREYLMNT